MNSYRYFKCNRLGGFRLSDLNRSVNQGDCFFVESHIVETSRSLIASLRERWMIEIDEKDYKENIEKKIRIQSVQAKDGVALPKATSETLESRQAANNHLDRLKKKSGGAETKNDVSVPDLNKAQEKINKEAEANAAPKKVVLPKMTKEDESEKTVKALSNEDNFEEVATPNLDKKSETNDLKSAIEAELDQKITKRRRRKATLENVVQ